MAELTNTQKIQQAELSLLKVFMDFCKQHNLRWYMVGGSLIGTMRHKGFVPWDDDIDIGMPRPDYDKFVNMQDQYPKGYSIMNHTNTPDWHFNFSQFCDDESEIIIHMNEKPRKCKVWIDIFPQDGSPNNKLHRWLHIKRIMMYRHLIQIANLRTQVKKNVETRPWYESLILKILHFVPVGILINSEKLLKKMDKHLRKHNYEGSVFAGNYLGRYREKGILPMKWWAPAVWRDFEDTQVSCPNDTDSLLTHFYGNYMKMPPEEKRISHYAEIVKLREYDKNEQNQ